MSSRHLHTLNLYILAIPSYFETSTFLCPHDTFMLRNLYIPTISRCFHTSKPLHTSTRLRPHNTFTPRNLYTLTSSRYLHTSKSHTSTRPRPHIPLYPQYTIHPRYPNVPIYMYDLTSCLHVPTGESTPNSFIHTIGCHTHIPTYYIPTYPLYL